MIDRCDARLGRRHAHFGNRSHRDGRSCRRLRRYGLQATGEFQHFSAELVQSRHCGRSWLVQTLRRIQIFGLNEIVNISRHWRRNMFVGVRLFICLHTTLLVCLLCVLCAKIVCVCDVWCDGVRWSVKCFGTYATAACWRICLFVRSMRIDMCVWVCEWLRAPTDAPGPGA